MGFLGVYRAVYDYSPQGESELEIKEGDILYVLENSGEDGWWKAKKKASADDDDEPVGLVPHNYVEEAQPESHARALFDYTRQTDEELSFTEDARLQVFDTSDPDWILVGLDGEYGFAPANYIELAEEQPPLPARRPISTVEEASPEPEPPSPVHSPAAAMANVMRKIPAAPLTSAPALALPPRPQFTPEASDEEEASPALPARPASIPAQPREERREMRREERREERREPEIRSPVSPAGIAASPPYNRASYQPDAMESKLAPGGYHLYNINEMISVMGKRKKMPTTLGINLATGTIMIAPEKTRDGPQQEWTGEKMKSYNLEGKHVFLELVRPSKSIEFHAGAKDTAQEIIQALGELAGAMRAEGLREVLIAGSGQGQKTGKVLYDFMAQGDDEVTVAVDDEVIIIDDTKSEEWWQVRRLKNGNEGVVPSSYIEITGVTDVPSSMAGINSGRSKTEQNRREEERLARLAVKSPDIGPGMKLPERGSSRRTDGNAGRSSKSKPDSSKVRTWTDRSKSFSVDAQFLTLKDGKIHLHKVNGVKIAVPVAKMSTEDLSYVERVTGVSLDEDKPLSDIKRQQSRARVTSPQETAGAIIDKKPDYDWFQFFLSCDIAVGLCERYSQIFNKNSIDESVLPDVDAVVLRNLGIREGDIIKIVRHLDGVFHRKKKGVSFANGDEEAEGSGGLFSGPGGALRNNTRKGRPAPTVQTNDVVDAAAFSQDKGAENKKPSSEGVSTPLASAPRPAKKDVVRGGFDDDAWDVKPAKEQPQTPITASNPAPVQQAQQIARPPSAPPAPILTGSMQDLSLLTKPLEPTRLQPQPTPAQFQQTPPQQQSLPPQQIPQPTGANPSFFAGLGPQQTGAQPQNQQFSSQQTNYGQQQMPQNIARQRPVVPQLTQGPNSLVPPPPPRPLSAPQTPQQSTFGPPPPLQAQMTGMPNSGGFQSIVAQPGTSLAEMNQMRMQQQYQQQQQQQMQQQQMQPQPTGFPMQNNGMMPQPTGFGQFNNPGMQQQQQPNGFQQQFQPQQQNGFGQQPQFMNGNQPQNSPFADPTGRQSQFSPLQAQPTGFQSSFPQQQFPQQTGINSFLPPPLQPQPTGALISGFGSTSGFGQPPPPPPMRQPGGLGIPAPLIPQKTGPPPPVRFGVNNDAKKLAPQPTGRRANLAAATPQNPFGF